MEAERIVKITACFCGLVLWQQARAQDVGDVRVDLHPPNVQVGIVSRATGSTAWVRASRPVALASSVVFAAFADGSDPLAKGRVAWVTPIAPYDCYVTQIAPVKTKHAVNAYDSAFATESIAHEKKRVGARAIEDGYGVELAKGFYARFAPIKSQAASSAVAGEPVRLLMGALKQRKNKIAQAMAEAVSRALPATAADPLSDEVNYGTLATNLRRFRRMIIEDPITDYLFTRLLDQASAQPVLLNVPADILRPPDANNGGYPESARVPTTPPHQP